VRVFVVIEAVVLAAAGVVFSRSLAQVVAAVSFGGLPPWRALVGVPFVGAGAYALRALKPVDVVRRWHGVVVRRIDERWAER
jgi:hypothetical protein